MEDIKTHKLVLYNDSVNDYNYIMACLIRFCKHDPIQAEQCAIIAHNVGQCSVKSGDFLEMLEIKSTFEELQIKIEVYESHMH
jgi:ATP-dependent Clp protease adaptor protein ClpS